MESKTNTRVLAQVVQDALAAVENLHAYSFDEEFHDEVIDVYEELNRAYERYERREIARWHDV